MRDHCLLNYSQGYSSCGQVSKTQFENDFIYYESGAGHERLDWLALAQSKDLHLVKLFIAHANLQRSSMWLEGVKGVNLKFKMIEIFSLKKWLGSFIKQLVCNLPPCIMYHTIINNKKKQKIKYDIERQTKFRKNMIVEWTTNGNPHLHRIWLPSRHRAEMNK